MNVVVLKRLMTS